MKKTILIDLDGVLNEYSGLFNENIIPPIKHGAKDFLEHLSQSYNIKIFTVRNKIVATKWLIENKIDHFIKDITDVKDPFTSLIIDDRALGFNGSFEEVLAKTKDFKPYWKK